MLTVLILTNELVFEQSYDCLKFEFKMSYLFLYKLILMRRWQLNLECAVASVS